MSGAESLALSARMRATQLKDGNDTEHANKSSNHLISYSESFTAGETGYSIPSRSLNKPPAQHRTRKHSTGSSSSAYSSNEADPHEQQGASSESSATNTKRLGAPSKGSADRRRLAIVQVDRPSDSTGKALHDSSSATGSIRERRGYKNNLAGLALMAPPDAALHSYTHLTPPSTAPVSGDNSNRGYKTAQHHRSASDIASHNHNPQHRKMTDHDDDNNTASPSSPSPAPTLSRSVLSTTADRTPVAGQGLHSTQFGYQDRDLDNSSPIHTPVIGEGKDIHIPVAPPIVVNLEQSQPKARQNNLPSSRSSSPTRSGYGNGSQSTSTSSANHVRGGHGNSEYPPRHPGRLHTSPQLSEDTTETSREKRHLRSPASTSKMSGIQVVSEAETAEEGRLSGHRREGATTKKEQSVIERFSVNSSVQTPLCKPLPLAEETTPKQRDDTHDGFLSKQRNLPPTPTVEPPTPFSERNNSPSKVDHPKFNQWLNQNPHFGTHDSQLDEPQRRRQERPRSPISADHHSYTLAVEPPEAPKGFKYNLATNLKRLSSLSRGASLSSRSRSSQETRHSRTPSPRLNHFHSKPRPRVQKIISMNPAALYCHEVDGQNTTLQRCMIYANKINELYMYDCGLSDWIREQNLNPQRSRGPSSSPLVTQPRHTSRSSVISEATFPRRPDATTATDLSQGQHRDITSPGLPPQLPYPSLAVNNLRTAPIRSNTSSSSITPPSSLRSLTPFSNNMPGFFASLGRKASLSKKERTIMTPVISSPISVPNGARLPIGRKNSQPPNPTPGARPIQITTPPTIPGGPRAPPSRAKRSQTYMASSASQTAHNALGRRPSLANVTVDTVIDIKPDPDFAQQVDRLAALLPRANPEILAGYLRRAGTDMLAIGQYLEDERMGTIRLQ